MSYFYIYIENIMAEHFKRKIIGNLSDKPIILKKINPIPTTSIVKPIIPEEEPIVSEEIIENLIEEITETPIEEVTVSEEIIETPIEEVTISEEVTETPVEEQVVSEISKPKRTRKKK